MDPICTGGTGIVRHPTTSVQGSAHGHFPDYLLPSSHSFMIPHTYLDPESPFRFWAIRHRGRIIARRPKGLTVIPVFVCSIWGMQGLNLCPPVAAFWLRQANLCVLASLNPNPRNDLQSAYARLSVDNCEIRLFFGRYNDVMYPHISVQSEEQRCYRRAHYSWFSTPLKGIRK